MVFCKYCGAQLAEGEVCTCEKSRLAAAEETASGSGVSESAQTASSESQQPFTADANTTQQPSAAKIVATSAAKSIVPYLKAFFTDPAGAVKDVVRTDNMLLAVTLLVIRALSAGLAFYGLIRCVGEEAADSASGYLKIKITPSILHCLLYGCLIALLGVALFTVTAFLIAKIQKSSASFKACFEVTSANGVLVSILLLLSFLFSFVSTKACMIFLLLAIGVWQIIGVLSVQILSPRQNEAFWILYIVGILVINFASVKLMPNLVLNAVGETRVKIDGKTETLSEYSSNAIDELREFFDDFSLSDLLEDSLDLY